MNGIRLNIELIKKAARDVSLCVIFSLWLTFSASAAAIEVPFLNQWPDGYVAGNMNCGPACCVMVNAALRNKVPSVVDLKGTLDFLKGDHRQYQGKLEGYWHTDLVNALSGYFGFSSAGWDRGMGLDVLKPYLDKGIPIIANVSQVFDPYKPNHRYSNTDHWIVVEDYDQASVQIVDPGRTQEVNGRGQYSITEFNSIFGGTFVYPMTTQVGQQHPVQNEPVNTLDLAMIKRLLNMTRSEIIDLMGSDFVNDHVTDVIMAPYTLIFWKDEMPLIQIVFLGKGTEAGGLSVGMTLGQVEKQLGMTFEFTNTDEYESGEVLYYWYGYKDGLGIRIQTKGPNKDSATTVLCFEH